jgi:hypothetical protein
MLSKHRLQVVDYFDSLVNEVDLKAEQSLAESIDDREKSELISRKRALFLQELKEMETLNLRHLEKLEPAADEDDIFKVFCFFIDKTDMEMSHVRSEIDAVFGYLLVLEDEHMSKERLARFRKYLKFYNKSTLNSFDYFNLRLNVSILEFQLCLSCVQ